MKIGPKYKICKRLGSPIFEKCQTQQFQVSQARSAKSKKRRRGGSEYLRQLLEKQKLRLTYGLSEKQFRKYVTEALLNHTNPTETLFQLLESRLDSVIYRMGLSSTRRAARQIVSHGHICVNGRRITIPSYQVKTTDTIQIREGSRTTTLFANTNEKLADYRFPRWVTFDPGAFEGKMKETPVFADQDGMADMGAVFEYYTR
ncbi:30S ribosomal protein S4 [Candidatus Kaiserbacteria bacterium CG10_big_fil_rev_8_21_14_0_10_45_20]|uniref:Small ribosomal subunit protein uS4 n=1 Tax=Candidatus Kaiserbacteria bacterium CG10_big_fil_rev_8_21_14_0_10_45_20 TaxID=1974607 RepID=A0A2H0UIA9_9BACT|nr:MAG: 30S ribosomal protein S4 [Candidatus Kaiserbacteria bacterium CG10_big_fil_rev_8_21_14_0_10_45_20]